MVVEPLSSLVSRLWTFASLKSQLFGSVMPNCVGRGSRLIQLSSNFITVRTFPKVCARVCLSEMSGKSTAVMLFKSPWASFPPMGSK